MMKWFHKLRVAQKLTLVSVFFMIPDSVMLYLFINSINQNIDVARLEQAGNQYQRAVEPLLDLIPEHRLLTRTPADRRDAARLAAVRTEIDKAFDTLATVNARIGATLDFTPEGLQKRGRESCAVPAVRDAWLQLSAASDGPPSDELDQGHLAVTASLRAMIAHAGDNSNLILDPELDSYYLMDTTLLALPQTQDRLTQVMVDAIKCLHAAGHAQDERVTLAIDLAFLKHDDLERIQTSTNTALTNGNPDYGPNATFHVRVPPLLKRYADAATRFSGLLERLQTSDAPQVTEADLLSAGRAARSASFRLWTVADEELDHLLESRIRSYQFRRTRSLGVAACAVLAAALLVTFITRSISGPLQRQAAELRDAFAVADAERRLAERRLVLQQAAETELRAVQDQLVAASRHAGMAEVATGVLHNVGNVLNSVNVSVHQIKDKIQASSVTKLTRTADLLDTHKGDLKAFLTDDAKGRLVPDYVCKLARLLGGENAAVMDEIENLSRGVEHIKQVVQFQQSFACSSTLLETLDPTTLLDDALRLNMIALDRHGVTVVREVQDIGPVRMDKHKTLQILVNLISNAKNAMADVNANNERRLTLRMAVAPAGDAMRLRIAVVDNGTGIAPENLSRIFAHGFTTRPDGHGFGLHSAANAAREMGGSLDVFSAGPGQGATFTLELPIERASIAQREVAA